MPEHPAGAERAGAGRQVISDKYWTVALDGLVVGDNGITGINATGAIMDTGTSLLTATDDDARAVNSVRANADAAVCRPRTPRG
jgi:hypothetical protein